MGGRVEIFKTGGGGGLTRKGWRKNIRGVVALRETEKLWEKLFYGTYQWPVLRPIPENQKNIRKNS